MGDGDILYKNFISIIIIIIITIIITITLNTVFKMGISFPGSLKAEQDVNFARFTTHVLLPIFPEESWVLERIRIRVLVENFESGKKKPFP